LVLFTGVVISYDDDEDEHYEREEEIELSQMDGSFKPKRWNFINYKYK
jgi:hypothetical protein